MDDDIHWENDIDFSRTRKIHSNIYARYPDKDLEDAFARLHGPEEYDDDDDDDDETETTYNSHHSDKLNVKEQYDPLIIPGLDDYMLGSPCSGVITRIGTHKQVLDDGDWEEDIKLPSKGLPPNPFIRPSAVETLDIHDDEPPPQLEHRHHQQVQDLPLDRKVRFLNLDQINTYTPENNEEEEETYDDIGFPDDMERLAIKRSTSPPPIPLTIPTDILQQQKQKPQQRLASKYSSNIENDDDDDFCKDLNIESDDVFQPKKKTVIAPTSSTATATTITPVAPKGSKPKGSLIPRRAIQETKLPQPTTRSSPLVSSLANRQQHAGFRAPTFASRQRQQISSSNPRGGNISPSSSTTLPKRVLEKPQKQRRNKTNVANGTTLISKPRSSIKYGNGSELDNHDILPDWRRRTLSNRKSLTEKSAGNTDPQRPWRQSMTHRKPKLIRPNDRTLNKECNDMKYDAEKHQWQGNEKNDLSFPSGNNNTNNRNPPSSSSLPKQQQRNGGSPTRRNKGHRLPALITSMNKKSHASKNAEVVVGTMVFDPVEMRWNKAPNLQNDKDDAPENVLAHIEDLDASTSDRSHPVQKQSASIGQARLQDKTREFRFSIAMKHLIEEQEQDHIKNMEYWGHLKKEESVFFPNNKPVRTFTYLLYRPDY
ncbi:hypothetical protein BDA99DRAFT_95897 [Phascolomyces articulosus]|uniref:Uncharacterized protein n=1 Tax=Phascolomyces articulosus TaxID=60185 RepID=A0AAD5K8C4_9FUNG|nr:hypothetical protein BDA99DRAFT_95897 [Phascolomyces articulosus]